MSSPPRRPDEALANQAATLGSVVRAVRTLLDHRAPGIGQGRRMNLRLPRALVDGERAEQGEAGYLPQSEAEVGEVLCVHDHVLRGTALREALLAFLQAAFEPLPMSGRKVLLVVEECAEGVVFRELDVRKHDR